MQRILMGAIIGPVIALALGALLWGGILARASPVTVPGAVLQDAQGAVATKWGTTREEVWNLFLEESANVRRQGFPLQPVTVDVSDPYGWLERTVICPGDCGQRVLLLRETYLRADQARYVIAYGLARVLAVDVGLQQDTGPDNTTDSERSNQFAACFGTAGAQREARRQLKAEPDCAALAVTFQQKKAGAP